MYVEGVSIQCEQSLAETRGMDAGGWTGISSWKPKIIVTCLGIVFDDINSFRQHFERATMKELEKFYDFC